MGWNQSKYFFNLADRTDYYTQALQPDWMVVDYPVTLKYVDDGYDGFLGCV